jgi:hypothetical protein
LSSLKERYDGCDMLLGTSPLVCVTASSKPQKPFIFSVTHPSGGFKKPKTVAGSAGEGGKTSAAAGGTAATEGGGISLPKAGAGARPMIGGMRQAGEFNVRLPVLVLKLVPQIIKIHMSWICFTFGQQCNSFERLSLRNWNEVVSFRSIRS